MPDPIIYRSLFEKLNFLTNTRPDISYSVQTLSQYMQHPTDIHFAALKHTLSYISCTVGQGILLQGSDKFNLYAFLTQSGPLVWILASQSQVTSSCWDNPPLVRSQRNNPLSPNLALKQNIELSHPPLQKSYPAYCRKQHTTRYESKSSIRVLPQETQS